MKKRQSVSKIAKAAVQEVKDNAKDIMNTPIVEKAKETVKDVAEKAEDTVKTVTKAAKDALLFVSIEPQYTFFFFEQMFQ